MSSPLLLLKNISVTFSLRRGLLHAVDGLSLALHKGEILGLVGESGSGKSMTGAAIMGLLEPPGRLSAGEVWFEGKRIDHNPHHLRGKKIAMIFQDPLTSLNPLETIGNQLIETIRTHMHVTPAEAKNRAKRSLEEVGIDPDRLHAYPHAFSGGMRQRVVIALALAAEPNVIIADEPTTALDVSIQAQILQLLKNLCRERDTAIILITHDMAVIAEITDRIAVMYAGRLVEIGTTKSVMKMQNHPYTRGLIASTPTLDINNQSASLYQIQGAMPRLDALPNGCAFHPRCDACFARCAQETPVHFPIDTQKGSVACWLFSKT